MTLTGAELREFFERSVENTFTDNTSKKVGGIIQVSGVAFEYDPDAAPGRRVRGVTVGGSPLDLRRRYSVATNSMFAAGGRNYRTFLDGKARREHGSQYEMVHASLARGGEVTAPSDRRVERVAAAR